MRHYIRTITHVENHDEFAFTNAIDEGRGWDTEKRVQDYLAFTDPSGRTLAHSAFNPMRSVCTDFRVERRQDGRYVISCNLNL